jgi:hypothetical protein
MSSISELPPGTVGLSLREALAIASHRAGPDRIGFDPAAFPAGAVIAVDAELEVGGDGTTIDATTVAVTVAGRPSYTGTLLHVTGTDVVLDGIALRGGGIAVEATGVSGLAVRRLAIFDTSREAIWIDGCSQITIEDSRIERSMGDPMFVRATDDARVARNFIALRTKMGSVHGIYLVGVNRSHIIDNVVDPGDAWLISLTDSSDNEVSGNILDRGDTGLTIFGTSQRNFVFRNVVISPAQDSIYVDSTPTDNTIVNNTFYLASDIVNNGINTTAKNNLVSTSAEDFVDPAAYDFQLVTGCPSIDAATDLGYDMLPDQPALFLGMGPDLGAVESY